MSPSKKKTVLSWFAETELTHRTLTVSQRHTLFVCFLFAARWVVPDMGRLSHTRAVSHGATRSRSAPEPEGIDGQIQ